LLALYLDFVFGVSRHFLGSFLDGNRNARGYTKRVNVHNDVHRPTRAVLSARHTPRANKAAGLDGGVSPRSASPQGSSLSGYPFFGYRVQQALALSVTEEHLLTHAVTGLQQESEQPADAFSQLLLSTQLDVLLQYASRFYYQQFPAAPPTGPDLLSRFEDLLTTYIDSAVVQCPLCSILPRRYTCRPPI
jgi:hypothetical protein